MQANQQLRNPSISALVDEILAMQVQRPENSSISAFVEEVLAMQVKEQPEYSSGSTLIGFVIVVAIVFLAFNLLVLVN